MKKKENRTPQWVQHQTIIMFNPSDDGVVFQRIVPSPSLATLTVGSLRSLGVMHRLTPIGVFQQTLFSLKEEIQ